MEISKSIKRVLVTGASGQLGLSLQDLVNEYSKLEFDFRNSIELDITHSENLYSTLKAGQFHYCINCAAYTKVDEAEKNSKIATEVNAEAVKNLALHCKQLGVILIHLSTDYVFDGTKKSPYTIHDQPKPINEYGKSKLKGEQYIQEILIQYYIVRTSWLYHKIHGNNFYKTILEKAKKDNVLRITDKEIGCPTDAKNLARYILNIIVGNNTKYGIYHFTGGTAMTWYDFAKKIIVENNLTGSTKLIRDNSYHSLAKRPRLSILK